MPNNLFSSMVCWFESVYSSLSWVPASSPTALTCSQQLWFLHTKEWKENSVHNLSILSMSQLPSQRTKCASFSLQSSEDCPQNWTKGSIDSDMFISTGVLVSNKVLLSVWSLGEVPVICIFSWTQTSAGLICVLFPVAQQKAVGMFTDVFANHFARFLFLPVDGLSCLAWLGLHRVQVLLAGICR